MLHRLPANALYVFIGTMWYIVSARLAAIRLLYGRMPCLLRCPVCRTINNPRTFILKCGDTY